MYIYKNANLSFDGKHRFDLIRKWDEGKVCNFIMLNPSTGDHEKDDPTIRRCVHFSKKLGCGKLIVTNLFSYRTYNPKDLLTIDVNRFQAKRDFFISKHAIESDVIVVAWSNHGRLRGRDLEVLKLLNQLNCSLLCLETNKNGTPRHPLYVKGMDNYIEWVRQNWVSESVTVPFALLMIVYSFVVYKKEG